MNPSLRPQNNSKSKVTIEGTIENKSCSTTWVDSKIVFEPYHDPKYRPFGPPKVKNDPKIKSTSKVRFEEIIEKKSCSTTLVDPKILFSSTTTPRIAK